MRISKHVTKEIRIRLLRTMAKCGFNQADVARTTKVSQPVISRILKERTKTIKYEIASRLASFVDKHENDHGLGLLQLSEPSMVENIRRNPVITAKGTGLRTHHESKVHIYLHAGHDNNFKQDERILRDINLMSVMLERANCHYAKNVFSGRCMSADAAIIEIVNSVLGGYIVDHYTPPPPLDSLRSGLSDQDNVHIIEMTRHLVKPSEIEVIETNGVSECRILKERKDNQRRSMPKQLETGIFLSDSSGNVVVNEPDPGHTNTLGPPSYIPMEYLEAQFDIASLVFGFIESYYDLSVNNTYQFVQRWLQDTFGLEHSVEFKKSCSSICSNLNRLFFGSATVSRAQAREYLSRKIDMPYLMRIIEASLEYEYSDWEQRRCVALGVFCLLRLNRLIRIQYHRTQENGSTSTEHTMDVPKKIRMHEMCIDATVALDSNHLLTRGFGLTVNIPGFNFVFKGGFLPGILSGTSVAIVGEPGTAKTILSLQIASDVAARGGLAVYLSLEENENAIAERITTFNLGARKNYDVYCSNGSAFESALEKAHLGSGGAILIHRVTSEVELSLESLVDRLGKLSEARWPEKAFILDSINDLYFDGSQPDKSLSHVSRDQLNKLVQYFEYHNFLSVIIVESVKENLPFYGVTGSVIKLGYQPGRKTRTLEILKCRYQDYHLGEHTLKITNGKGISIYPSLTSIRSALQNHKRIPPSEVNALCLKDIWHTKSNRPPLVQENSVTVIKGAENTGKTKYVAHWLTADQVKLEEGQARVSNQDVKVLIISFRSTEERCRSKLEWLIKELDGSKCSVHANYRWFHPGQNLTGGQFVKEVWNHLKRERRTGRPYDRLVFEDIDEIPRSLPLLAKEELFSSVFHELVTTEPISTLITIRSRGSESIFVKSFISIADYVFTPGHTEDNKYIVKCNREYPLDRRFIVGLGDAC